ncbi:hypothetical protein Tco_0092957 [Tanacetum coccineum]
MDNLSITIEEYIRLEEEKAHRRGKVYNWKTATYGKIWDNEDVHDLRSVETEFPAIVFNDTLTSEAALSCEPTVRLEFAIANGNVILVVKLMLILLPSLIYGEYKNEELSKEFIRELYDREDGETTPRFEVLYFEDYYFEDQYAVSIKEDTAYPCLHSPKITEDKALYAVSRETQYSVFKIWNEYNILEDIKRGPYSKKSPIRRDLDNSTSNVLIPLDSWTSGLLVYELPLSVTNQTVPVSQAENLFFPLELGTRTDIGIMDSIWEQDNDLEEGQEDDGDDMDTFDMWDITVEDVE